MYVKYWSPGPRFDAEKFAALARRNNIMCVPVEGGVVIDRDKLNATPTGTLPVWLAKNKASINNPLCTAEPTGLEIVEVLRECALECAM